MKYYKNLWLIIVFAFSMFGCSNQDAQSSDADKELMVTFEDSLSYSIGVNIGKNLPETEFNQELLIEGLTDYWNQEEPRLNAATALSLFKRRLNINAPIAIIIIERDDGTPTARISLMIL